MDTDCGKLLGRLWKGDRIHSSAPLRAAIHVLVASVYRTSSHLRLSPLIIPPAHDLSTVRFFAAHRVLSEFATQLGPGFGIRFTVQFNLFAGTVTAIGNPSHLALLEEMQRLGQLGCFALTEKLAGVNSGLGR